MQKKPVVTVFFVFAFMLGAVFFSQRAIAVGSETSLFGGEHPANETVLFVPVTNEKAAGAEDFIKSLAKRGIGFLSNGELSKEQKKEEFRTLLSESFDMKTIGRFALGRYWRVATPEQREEYLNLFKKMVIDVYSNRFNEYRGEGFEVRSYRKDGARDTIVSSAVVSPDGQNIQVDWRVRYKDGEYQVVDIIVEGVSMSVTQRSDFSSVIQRGGGNVEVLLSHLRKQTKSL